MRAIGMKRVLFSNFIGRFEHETPPKQHADLKFLE